MVDSPTRPAPAATGSARTDATVEARPGGASRASGEVREMSKRPNPLERAVNVWRYRELLVNLTRKELKVKYKNSVLGFVWTLLNPALYLVVFSLVFQVVLQVKIPYYGIFFLAGLLGWNFFATAVSAGTTSIVGNSQLVSKVWFPREILPLASIGAAIFHFLLQLTVLAAALILFRRAPSLHYLPALVPALVVLLLFASALAIALAAVNVYLRDTQHLLELVLLAWFWMTPVAYPYQLVADRLGPAREWWAAANPILTVVVTFQQALYNPSRPAFMWLSNGPRDPSNVVRDQVTPALPEHPLTWYLTRLGSSALVGASLLLGALWLFGRLEDNMAEEI
ncbi:MAG: ABC transporter permease [Actinobacteria bacterium]|nr:ABC transporter permease [Actinomycetota bacterium]